MCKVIVDNQQKAMEPKFHATSNLSITNISKLMGSVSVPMLFEL